jgi:hypothetical protein
MGLQVNQNFDLPINSGQTVIIMSKITYDIVQILDLEIDWRTFSRKVGSG